MKIGPRVMALDTRTNAVWYREINGTRYRFSHVKVTRLAHPYMAVSRTDTGEQIHCTCPRDDCMPQAMEGDRQ